MNCIAKKLCLLAAITSLCVACNAPATEAVVATEPLQYSILYTIVPNPSAGTIGVTMSVTQPRRLLRELRFANSARISDVRADGGELAGRDEFVWRPGTAGGSLSWTIAVANKRNRNGYDAWLDDSWGLLRAEDIVPRASTRALRGAYSKTSMRFELPDQWTVVSAYSEKDGQFKINKPHRRFDQPDGWIVMGQLGVRRETIAGIRIAVAAPVEQGVRRMDTLAMLNWTLPELARLLPDLPPRLTVVSAGSPMWRGGLSAPQSLFIHADRPLISENATSTLLHEVMHSTLRISTIDGYDWIVEGLAEYYSLQLLRRSGTISPARYRAALDAQSDWSTSAQTLCQGSSTGAVTALAVTIMAALDTEIRRATDGSTSLDDILPLLQQQHRPIDLPYLQHLVEQRIGKKSAVLDIRNLPGCRNITPGNQEKP